MVLWDLKCLKTLTLQSEVIANEMDCLRHVQKLLVLRCLEVCRYGTFARRSQLSSILTLLYDSGRTFVVR